MQKKFFLWLKLSVLSIFGINTIIFGDPLDQTDLVLEDGRTLLLRRINNESFLWRFSLLDQNKSLSWKLDLEDQYDALWNYVFFVKIYPKKYFADLNDDNYPEIAISYWDGGNAPRRKAFIFTVYENELKLYKIIESYPFESGYPLFGGPAY